MFYVKGCLFGLQFRHWHAWRGILIKKRKKKHFKKKSENAAHNASVILFAVDGWEENPITFDSGEIPEFPLLPYQCTNRQTHTDREIHTII